MYFFGFLATVLSSGVVAALTSFIMAARKDFHLSRQQKAEQLYMAADTFYRQLGGHFIGMLTVINDGGSIYTKTIEMDETRSRSQMKMLIAFYFPDVEPAWDRLDNARSQIVKAITEYHHGRAGVREYDAALSLWEPAGNALLHAISLQGRRFATFDPLTSGTGWVRDRISGVSPKGDQD